ncbi:MAG: chemotaxis protein CheB [Myxacorys californica WJT36-NPBG1]|jgi:two-component system chemotaxis response regulator CheB|nr:chemotaxis protein CheB [Myxacorys californica WJT36-NPBG1]
MLERNIIVVGASAGGVETLSQLAKALPADLPVAVFVTLHFPSYATSMLPQILNRCCTLPAMHANDGDLIELGRIYIAPPDYHLLLGNSHIRLDRGPRENGHRPAVDTMFRSAARSYGPRTIGVILSGMLDDGTAGLKLIKAHGGIAIVQDPSEALFDGMVSSAIKNVKVDAILRLSDLAAQLVVLSQNPVEEDNSMSNNLEQEAELVAQSKAELEQGEHPETSPSMVTCPDCGGVLWELRSNGLIRYRCHAGHAYSSDSLLSEQADLVETSLWSAVRALEEKAALAERMAKQAREQKRMLSEAQFLRRAEESRQQADVVRGVISTQGEKMQQVKSEESIMKE